MHVFRRITSRVLIRTQKLTFQKKRILWFVCVFCKIAQERFKIISKSFFNCQNSFCMKNFEYKSPVSWRRTNRWVRAKKSKSIYIVHVSKEALRLVSFSPLEMLATILSGKNQQILSQKKDFYEKIYGALTYNVDGIPSSFQ